MFIWREQLDLMRDEWKERKFIFCFLSTAPACYLLSAISRTLFYFLEKTSLFHRPHLVENI